MQLYTIGFTKKDARTFFELLRANQIQKVVDVRLNNVSQLAGYTKKNDLIYFLEQIGNMQYYHAQILAPTKEILDSYKKKEITWEDYEMQYKKLLRERNANIVLEEVFHNDFHKLCLLCSEVTAEQCHRRLAAEYIKEHVGNIEIIHL